MTTALKRTDVYSITILAGARADIYPCFASNHQEALEKALAGHLDTFGPLPVGTRCFVYGQCHDANCDCGGKDRGIVYFTSPVDRVTN